MKFITRLDLGILGGPDSSELWQKIISYIPDSALLKPHVKILNIACGHGTEAVILAKRMIALGIPKEKVNESMFLLDKYHTFTNQVKNTYGFRNVVTADFLEWKTDMKFDVVIGNPPFQSDKLNSDQLWPLFTEKAIDLTTDFGYVSLIIPDTWASGTRSLMFSGRKNLLSEVFNNFTVEVLNFDVKKHFTGIGSGFSSFVIQKKKTQKLTKIIAPSGAFKFNIQGFKFLPKTLNPMVLTIIKKVTVHNQECVYFKFYGKTPGVNLSEEKSKNHTFKYSNTSSNHSSMWGDKSGQGYGIKKVIYAYLGSKQKFEYDLSGDLSLMYNARAYEVPTKSTRDGLKSYFESKLIKFINKDKWSQYNEPKILNLLPVIDFSRSWSDAELYQYFGLSQAEIDLIESQVQQN